MWSCMWLPKFRGKKPTVLKVEGTFRSCRVKSRHVVLNQPKFQRMCLQIISREFVSKLFPKNLSPNYFQRMCLQLFPENVSPNYFAHPSYQNPYCTVLYRRNRTLKLLFTRKAWRDCQPEKTSVNQGELGRSCRMNGNCKRNMQSSGRKTWRE